MISYTFLKIIGNPLKNIVLFAALMLAVAGCKSNRASGHDWGAELYETKYSSGFSIYEARKNATTLGGNSSVVVVRDPWQGAEGVAMELFISRDGEQAPEGFTGTVVRAPVGRVVCLSSSHVAFIDTLGLSDSIVGVSGAGYISNEQLRQRHSAGEVADVGYDTNINYEVLASLRPDIVFVYGIGGQNTVLDGKLRELGINFVYVGEYLEQSALAKAEWIVFFGELFDRRAEAEEIFGGIASRYGELKSIAAKAAKKPAVMLNSPYRDVWFAPGGNSYMANLIADAGGKYLFADNDSSVSMPLSGEVAYMALSGADRWLNPGQARTIAELAAQNPTFANVPVVLEGQVFNATKRSTAGGGSDFWESGALRADRVLEDLIIILRPELMPEGELYYFERLE